MSKGQLSSVAVIGAGLAGLSCAQRLRHAGILVRVFDKGRGVGGRVATRRSDVGAVFDHGAQYFTVREEPMRRYVKIWIDAGVVAPWQARIGVVNCGRWSSHSETTRYVGVPTMTAIAKHLAQDLDIVLQTRITTVSSDARGWRLFGDTEHDFGRFDVVIVSAPAPQTKTLVGDAPEFTSMLQAVPMAPCWAVMVAFDTMLSLPFDAAFVEKSSLSWIARNSSKPGRKPIPDCWVLHASPEWSLKHMEDSTGSVTSAP